MTAPGRVALLAAAGVLLATTTFAEPMRRTTITIADHLSAGQREETIAVYLGGVLAGTLHVDATHMDDSFTAAVPTMDKLPFALCGKLLRQDYSGSLATHPIDNGGTLTGYEDGTWAAVTLGDVAFTLDDETGKGESTYNAAPACSAAVS